MSDPHFKSFEVEGHHVLIMSRGAGDKKDTRKIEQSTEYGGIFASAAVSLPYELADSFFLNYNQESAENFFNAIKGMFEGDD